VPKGIIQETQRKPYDLLILGASEEWGSGTRLFGSVDDWVIEQVGCSVLMVRHYESVAIHWIRQKIKLIEHS
jgi:nucleotide-binding universal stress UspA family protein